MSERPGQIQGRDERVREYKNWTGAKLVDANLQTVAEDPMSVAKFDAEAARVALNTIRASLELGVDNVDCSTPHRSVMDRIVQELTPEQRQKVHFSYFDVPRPTETVRATNSQ